MRRRGKSDDSWRFRRFNMNCGIISVAKILRARGPLEMVLDRRHQVSPSLPTFPYFVRQFTRRPAPAVEHGGLRMRKAILWAGLVLVLDACAETQVSYRNSANPNYGQTEFDRDLYQCRRENTHHVTMTMFGQVNSGPSVNEDMAAACMQARGWRPGASSVWTETPPQVPRLQVGQPICASSVAYWPMSAAGCGTGMPLTGIAGACHLSGVPRQDLTASDCWKMRGRWYGLAPS